jgi:small-conductance mechanosensitive channel
VDGIVSFAGPNHTLTILGVRLLGMNGITGKKLLLTGVFLLGIWLLSKLLSAGARLITGRRKDVRARFWSRQAVHLFSTVLFILCVVSIWLDDPARIGTMAGVITAGLAVALQRVITAVAGYFVILRGNTFNVGDRIAMAGVRGDVISLGYVHTVIMEMGEPPATQDADPSVWVESRQYTGRVVTVTNDKIFDQPIYNFTRAFPFIWEELKVPVKYDADIRRVEAILLDAARRHTQDIADAGRAALERMEHRFYMRPADVDPKVYLRLTDNWIEMTVRFCTREFGVRDVKDLMSRDILAAFREESIEVASATFEVVGVPALRLVGDSPPASNSASSPVSADSPDPHPTP